MKKKVLILVFLCLIPLIALLEFPLAQAYYGYAKYPAVGAHKLGVILVKFPGTENGFTPSYVDNLVFEEVNNFFKEASYGQFWLEGKTTSTWYELTREENYYAENFFGLNKDDELIQETINLASSEIYPNDYDQLLIIMPLPPIGFEGYYDPPSMSVAVSPPIWNTVAHELAHGLGPGTGLVDLYRYSVVNDWSLMGGVEGFCAWEKMLLGWIPTSRTQTVTIGESTTSWVDPLEINIDSSINVVKIPVSDYQFLMVEVRKKIGYDENIAPGVLISFAGEGMGNFEASEVPEAIFSLAPSRERERRGILRFKLMMREKIIRSHKRTFI